MTPLYVGLISGTSVDAVDAALVELPPSGRISSRAYYRHPIPNELRESLLGAFGLDSLQATLKLDVRMGRLFAEAVIELLAVANTSRADIRAIGSHGQTISHQPFGAFPHTLQIGDPNIIAEITGITTVADFRRRDVAAGGQGAPLAPAFHAALFGGQTHRRVIVNIGGIANLTILTADQGGEVIGFDTGPGNGLLDAWISKCHSKPMDIDAAWAASGSVDQRLLRHFLGDTYFSKPAPKSTGKETFNLEWIEQMLNHFDKVVDAHHVQRTLAELTVVTIADAVRNHERDCEEILVCGGGARNPLLIDGLRRTLPTTKVNSTNAYGIDPDYLEACAFAWLAKQTLSHTAGNLPSVTGATRPVVLGGVYCAS